LLALSFYIIYCERQQAGWLNLGFVLAVGEDRWLAQNQVLPDLVALGFANYDTMCN
jgi:hypothetical protein